jgi:acyl-CoA reductase-like NAD-dependent aldehyde dehydrogenase
MHTVGDPMQPGTMVGPLISERALERVMGFVDEAREHVTVGGQRAGGELERGFFVEPTVLSGISNDMHVAREEIFGPVLSIIPFEDEADAIRIANDTIYGLSGSVWSRDGAKALRTARAMETGVVSINSNTSVRVSTPFGGFKQSGVGRELGPDALEAYSEIKNVYYATEG